MREKCPYIALVFDLKKTPRYDNCKSERKFIGYQKEYSNKRWALYCSCGQFNELNDINDVYKNDLSIVFNKQIICKNCHKIYNDSSNVKLIYSRNPSRNVISRRFGVVEKDNFYALYSFSTVALVSVTTKKIIFKDSGDNSLYLSKKINAIRIKNNKKIITIPFKYLVKHCSSVINNMAVNVLYESKIEQNKFEHEFVNPLIKFCKIIESRCDERDVNRIINLLDKSRNETYFNLFFKNSDSLYHNSYDSFFEENCFYNIKYFHSCHENISPNRYLWLQYLKQRMCIMLAIHMYPPLATIAITYGCDKLLKLLTDSSLMCSLSDLRKSNPTNPKDIIETLFKRKIVSEFYKNKKIINYQKKEVKKRKRKLKSRPNDLVLQKQNFDSKSIPHPTLFLDHRIQNILSKDIKTKVNSIHFKKIYIDLFLEKFDFSSEIFYNFINNTLAFDNIETIEKILFNDDIKEPANFIFAVQKIYNQMRNRLDTNFKLTYKFIQHIHKIHSNKIYKNIILSDLIQLYNDTILMLTDMQILVSNIFKIKNSKELEDFHNSLVKSYEISKDKKLSSNLSAHINKYKNTECDIDNIRFTIIDTPERFYEESEFMSHCVKTYCSSVAQGQFIIYSLEDLTTKDRATLSVSISNIKDNIVIYNFNQLKSKSNRKATDQIINSTKKFIKKFFKIKDENSYDLKTEKIEVKKELEDIILEEIEYDNHFEI